MSDKIYNLTQGRLHSPSTSEEEIVWAMFQLCPQADWEFHVHEDNSAHLILTEDGTEWHYPHFRNFVREQAVSNRAAWADFCESM